MGAGVGALPPTTWRNGPSEAVVADAIEGRDVSNVGLFNVLAGVLRVFTLGR